MYRTSVILLCLMKVCLTVGAAQPAELEQAAWYSSSYEEADSFTPVESEKQKEESPKKPSNESPHAQHVNMGKVKMTVDVKNTDFFSECQSQWKKKQEEKNPSEKKRKSTFDAKEEEKEKENYSPGVSFSVEWSSKD